LRRQVGSERGAAVAADVTKVKEEGGRASGLEEELELDAGVPETAGKLQIERVRRECREG